MNQERSFMKYNFKTCFFKWNSLFFSLVVSTGLIFSAHADSIIKKIEECARLAVEKFNKTE